MRDVSSGNAFSEWGTKYHNLIEKVLKDEALHFEVIDEFNDFAINSKHEFPPNKYVDLREKTYNGVIKHLQDLSWIDDYEILSVEEKRKYDIKGIPFTSIADLEVIEKSTKEYGIIDHKLSNEFKKSELPKKLRQLYIYSYSFETKYGRFPDFLAFNHYKVNSKPNKIKFNKKEYDKTIEWLINKIKFIEEQKKLGEYPARCKIIKDKSKDWYATQLCNYRFVCPYSSLKK